jgi:hypothetical protein
VLRKDATNPHFKNNYLSLGGILEIVLPVLHKHGVTLTQHPSSTGGPAPLPALRTRLELAAVQGEYVEDSMLLMPGKADPQGQGSAITYARRYSLMSILALVADEDDDGNAASPRQQHTDVGGSSSGTSSSSTTSAESLGI